MQSIVIDFNGIPLPIQISAIVQKMLIRIETIFNT